MGQSWDIWESCKTAMQVWSSVKREQKRDWVEASQTVIQSKGGSARLLGCPQTKVGFQKSSVPPRNACLCILVTLSPSLRETHERHGLNADSNGLQQSSSWALAQLHRGTGNFLGEFSWLSQVSLLHTLMASWDSFRVTHRRQSPPIWLEGELTIHAVLKRISSLCPTSDWNSAIGHLSSKVFSLLRKD